MKNTKILFISLLALAMSLTSCLNDLEDFIGDFSGTPAIVEFPEAVSASTGLINREIINPEAPAVFKLKLNIASAEPLSVDTKVTLALDNALISVYNAKNDLTGENACVPVPTTALTVQSYEVVIPAGQREADWSFTISAANVPNSLSTKYILPVKIVSAENNVVVSGNYGSRLVRILARNRWDGIYTVTGTLTDVAAPTITGNYPMTVHLVTSTSYTCVMQEPAASPWGNPPIYHTIRSGGSLSVYGQFGVQFTFNDANAIASMVNYYGQPSANGRSGSLDPTGVNTYNPANKTITVKYIMNQPTPRTTFDEVWTYVGPR